ncbi:hypothetical protein MNV49_006961 [Pseudohyphozyma bogoriensis]|nr:hypothetical protein MNV49_006961 [Pseudohyphozyma bogoriensis]
MNNDAFRSLLSQSSSTPRPAGSSTPRFGAAPPKRSAGGDSKEKYDKPQFKPREKGPGKDKWKKKKEGSEDATADESAYRDRAAERRLGKDNDFSAAEKLLADFQARASGVEDKAMLEEQMKYLGGDAEHSVLVKGLDMALLERMKNKQSLEAELSLEDAEEALDKALAAPVEKKKRKTRDEIIAELKASRAAGGAGAGDEEGKQREKEEAEKLEQAKMAGRFKPIGAPKVSKKPGKEVEGREKKKRKKIKTTSTSETAPSTSTATAKAPSPPPKSTKATVEVPEDFDADADIFGDAGDYKGLTSGSDSDDDDGEGGAKSKPEVEPQPSTMTAAGKRKYFSDDEDDEGPLPSTVPSAVTNLANAPSGEGGARSGEGEGSEEEEEDLRTMRLQPLAGSSVPSVRDLLDIDKAAEADEKKKARKLKNKDKAEKAENMTVQDRANRDYLRMNAYLEKRKNKGGDE